MVFGVDTSLAVRNSILSGDECAKESLSAKAPVHI